MRVDWLNKMKPAALVRFFTRFGNGEYGRKRSMRLFPTILAALALVGCATKEQPPTPAETQLEKKDKREYNKEVDSRIQ
jgi:hypothetical protein